MVPIILGGTPGSLGISVVVCTITRWNTFLAFAAALPKAGNELKQPSRIFTRDIDSSEKSSIGKVKQYVAIGKSETLDLGGGWLRWLSVVGDGGGLIFSFGRGTNIEMDDESS